MGLGGSSVQLSSGFLKDARRIPGALHDAFEGIVALGAPGCSGSEAIWLSGCSIDDKPPYVYGRGTDGMSASKHTVKL